MSGRLHAIPCKPTLLLLLRAATCTLQPHADDTLHTVTPQLVPCGCQQGSTKLRSTQSKRTCEGTAGRGTMTRSTVPYLLHSSWMSASTCRGRPQSQQHPQPVHA